ncbi:uncharacterized protein cubi_03277 [Cryptosporidium ubiquitum]|uniref:EF-hand domain-containing protein n=1 Tax=Cryptosporidium ubiquitum TaxID=857276 RepID=A0A1J4MBX4_9CRYT|nr:uncharacterized protein cubi_03277 [Cryptosporidium ubiquitum]OII70979.1 hypothetical protein cubi_03277 [Cryptosporidium ubiquitum]
MPVADIENCAKIFDCEKKNQFDAKLSHRILILAGFFVNENTVQEYMETNSKKSLTIEDLKSFAGKPKFGIPPTKESIKNMFDLLDVGKSGKVDLDLLKYGLTSIGTDTFSSSETEEFYKSLDINLSETKAISIDQMIENLMKMLSEFE